MEDHDAPSKSFEFEVVSSRPRKVGWLGIKTSGYGLRIKKTTGSLGSNGSYTFFALQIFSS